MKKILTWLGLIKKKKVDKPITHRRNNTHLKCETQNGARFRYPDFYKE